MPDHTLLGMGIAVTRPPAQANRLNQLISQHGGQAFNVPLIEIVPLADYGSLNEEILSLPSFDWAIFISSNAVNFGLTSVIKTLSYFPAHLKVAAIGPVTASELTAQGVSQVLTPAERFDSESLLALPEMHDMLNRRVAIFRGIGGRELLAETLISRGAKVEFFECYQRINPQIDDLAFQQLWEEKRLDAIVVTSSEAMRYLLDIANHNDWFKHITLCVNHARIAEQPLSLGLKVKVANAPGDDAMLECLIELAKSRQD